jgi:hypothetical protein
MQKYVLAYHGNPEFSSPEAGQQHMQKWQKWMESLGSSIVDPGMPVGKSSTVSKDGVVDNGGPDPISGYTVLQADTEEAVLEMAKACPHIAAGGRIEVAPAMEM